MADVDDSLLLSYSPYYSKPKGTGKAALSASTCRRYAEDPHKFYLEKVEGLDEPPSIPLAVGIGGHEAMEKFLELFGSETHDVFQAAKKSFKDLRDGLSIKWDEVPDKSIKVNREDPTNPRNREKIEMSFEDMIDLLEPVLWGLFSSMDADVGRYEMLRAQRDPEGVEVPLGKLAKESGLPWDTIHSYDPVAGHKRDMKVAVIEGVPVRGRADAICNFRGGGRMILDHKFTSKVVPYYPPYNGNGKWKMYEPSYNARDSFQLDLYAGASGIGRAGFQFLLRRPQHSPEGRLHPEWVDERVWRESDNPNGLPAMLIEKEGDLRYVGVWRPQPGDHPDAGEEFTPEVVRQRAGKKLRGVAERMTESFLLLGKGVEPKIAFPPGSPEVIGRKACPYCHFNDTDACRVPQDFDNKGEKRRKTENLEELLSQREELCKEIPEIQDRRMYWRSNYPRTQILPTK